MRSVSVWIRTVIIGLVVAALFVPVLAQATKAERNKAIRTGIAKEANRQGLFPPNALRSSYTSKNVRLTSVKAVDLGHIHIIGDWHQSVKFKIPVGGRKCINGTCTSTSFFGSVADKNTRVGSFSFKVPWNKSGAK